MFTDEMPFKNRHEFEDLSRGWMQGIGLSEERSKESWFGALGPILTKIKTEDNWLTSIFERPIFLAEHAHFEENNAPVDIIASSYNVFYTDQILGSKVLWKSKETSILEF